MSLTFTMSELLYKCQSLFKQSYRHKRFTFVNYFYLFPLEATNVFRPPPYHDNCHSFHYNVAMANLSIDYVAKLLKTKKSTVYQHIHRNHYKKNPQSVSVDKESFKRYVAEQGKLYHEKYQHYLNIYRSLG